MCGPRPHVPLVPCTAQPEQTSEPTIIAAYLLSNAHLYGQPCVRTATFIKHLSCVATAAGHLELLLAFIVNIYLHGGLFIAL